MQRPGVSLALALARPEALVLVIVRRALIPVQALVLCLLRFLLALGVHKLTTDPLAALKVCVRGQPLEMLELIHLKVLRAKSRAQAR